MSSSQKVEIQLLGQKVSLKASESDPALLKEIVELVSSKVKSAEKRTKGGIASQVLLLALLEIAEEYVKAKHRTIHFKREVGEKSENLNQVLVGIMEGDNSEYSGQS
jgi:cell division protein ZapA (FtsZ GTPase activity inhibitor)